jgi:hypothetical protein
MEIKRNGELEIGGSQGGRLPLSDWDLLADWALDVAEPSRGERRPTLPVAGWLAGPPGRTSGPGRWTGRADDRMGHSLMGVRRTAEAPSADDARQLGRWRANGGRDGQRTDAGGRTTDIGHRRSQPEPRLGGGAVSRADAQRIGWEACLVLGPFRFLLGQNSIHI